MSKDPGFEPVTEVKVGMFAYVASEQSGMPHTPVVIVGIDADGAITAHRADPKTKEVVRSEHGGPVQSWSGFRNLKLLVQ